MIKSVADLHAAQAASLKKVVLRKADEVLAKEVKSDYKYTVLICGGTGCTSSHSLEIVDELKAQIKANNVEKDVQVIVTGCFGLCALGPIMIVYPEGCFYSMVKTEELGRIVKRVYLCESAGTYHLTCISELKSPVKEIIFFVFFLNIFEIVIGITCI